ncbi:MAG: ATP synthase F1 subunit epsilon [Coriobacteriales bacterium]|jgi:F-type H+-transporting ATPase subunit epsilon|nr:ATP synthase F1 subunit epsilon [Coriobacteriales bacterium]
MADTLVCDIVTPDTLLFSGEAVLVSAPAAEGDIGLMYQCSPLMSTLRRGAIRIKGEDDQVTTFAVDGGYLEVDGLKVVVLASRAINLDRIDRDFAKSRIEQNKKRIAEMEKGDPARAFAESQISWQEYLIGLN